MVGCVYARQVWFGCGAKLGIQFRLPTHSDALGVWWRVARAGFSRKERRGFDTLTILVCWLLWKQRNAGVFNNTGGQFTVEGLVDQIVMEWEL